MPMLKQKKFQNKIKLKKSQICLFGSLLVIGGIVALSYNHILLLKQQVISDMLLSFSDDKNIEEVIDDMPTIEEVSQTAVETPVVQEEKKQSKPIDYSKYTGVLEIPKIGLKRGFYSVGNRYNDIKYNVTMINGSTTPDVLGGNLVLAAHSGDAYISYFAYLYKLNVGDQAFVTYGGNTYKYQIVNIYNVPKTGAVTIHRNLDRTTLTLITCTKNSDTEQTVYIAEMI